MLAKKVLGASPSHDVDQTVVQDADRLVRVYGAEALETAGVYSWQEDIGLLYTAEPDHWLRVRRELEKRFNTPRDGQAERTSKIQKLHLI